jgi:hypothetical protein
LNTSASCTGIEVHEYVTGRKPFNPNKCAWAFEVLKGKLRIGQNLGLVEAWSDVGPEGIPKVPDYFDYIEPSPGYESAEWRYLLCVNKSDTMAANASCN